MKCCPCRKNYKKIIKKDGRQFLQKLANINLVGEIGEVIDIVKKNGDRRSIEDLTLREHLVEELADVLMYYNEILLCYGISEDELKEAYISKFETNLKRW